MKDKHPSRVSIRVPMPDREGSAVRLDRQLEALLGELRELGFGHVLVAWPGPRSPSWELLQATSPVAGWQPWIAAWSVQDPAPDREASLAAALGQELREKVLAGRPLAVVWPNFSEEGTSPFARYVHFDFTALIDLGEGQAILEGRSFYFVYPRQAAQLREFFAKRPAAPPPVDEGEQLSADHRGSGRRREELLGEQRAAPPDRSVPDPPPMPGPPTRGKPSRPRTSSGVTKKTSEVYLGVALPDQAAPGDYFVARFAAYTAACRREIRRIFRNEAPGADQLLDLERTRWKIGTRVVVQLAIDGATVDPPVQHFAWQGQQQILRFDVRVDPRPPGRQLVLRFDVFIAGVRVLALRPELALADGRLASPGAPQELEVTAPKSAFASYAHQDEAEVLGRIRSVEICTGMDVFVDRFGILPGRPWEEVLAAEIARRDLFWLFWSRRAMASQHVEWEWRKALAEKTLKAILPHPLEPADLAPPPPELAAIQFGGAYESYLQGLADRAERPRRG